MRYSSTTLALLFLSLKSFATTDEHEVLNTERQKIEVGHEAKLYKCLEAKLSKEVYKSRFFHSYPALHSFIENLDASTSQETVSKMLNLILLESRFNSSQVSDTDGYRHVDFKTALKTNRSAINHQSNFGIASISADRLILRPQLSFMAVAKAFGIEAEKPKDKKLSTLKASYKSLFEKLDPEMVARNCSTPSPLRPEFVAQLISYNQNFSQNIEILAQMVSGKRASQNNSNTTAFFATLLNSCPKLNLELSLNEFESGAPERYYSTLREQKANPKFGKLCSAEIDELLKQKKSATAEKPKQAPVAPTQALASVQMILPEDDLLPPQLSNQSSTDSLLPDELTKAEAALMDDELASKLSQEELLHLENELRKKELSSLHESVKNRFTAALEKISILKQRHLIPATFSVVIPDLPTVPKLSLSPLPAPTSRTLNQESTLGDSLLHDGFTPHNFLSSAIQNCNLEQIEAMLSATKRSLAFLSFDDPDFPVLNANIFALETQKIRCESGASPLAQRQTAN